MTAPRPYDVPAPIQARHSASTIWGPHGFILTEVVFRGAGSGHELYVALRVFSLTAG